MTGRQVLINRGPLRSSFLAVPSKSVTHRALVAAALADGESCLQNPLDARDTRVTGHGLEALGFPISFDNDGWRVQGLGGKVPGGGRVALHESGTSLRLLTAVAALGEAPSLLDGAPRLRERPLRELAEVLVRLGARMAPADGGEGLPLTAGGDRPRGGEVRVPANRTSQFASGLLLIGARLAGGLRVTVPPPTVSSQYIDLTAEVLRRFDVPAARDEDGVWAIPQSPYAGRSFRVDGDHSSASYLLAAAAVVGGSVRVEGLDPKSAQPDARLGSILEQLGCEVIREDDAIEVRGDGTIAPFDLEVGDTPDLVPTLAVLALFADGPSTLRCVSHLRLKESDRVAGLVDNLRAFGCDVESAGDRLTVEPHPRVLKGTHVDTASDHRIAMAFAIAGLRLRGVTIDDPGCVAKSNPTFWDQLQALEG
jgi:3-phosphoshikimate 1-carboxyvinyltransferase